VLANAQRMQELIDGLLTLSGVVRAELMRVPVDLSRLAQEVAQEIRETAPERPPKL
jgi:signal transduction histidine kinase